MHCCWDSAISVSTQHWTVEIKLPRMSFGYDKIIHICQRTAKPLQPSWATFNLLTTRTTHTLTAFLIIIKDPQSVLGRKWKCQASSLWGCWWLLWLSTLNFNPQQSTVPHCVELYVLLMMAKFHAWKAGIVGSMKGRVSHSLSLSPGFFLFSLSFFSFPQ